MDTQKLKTVATYVGLFFIMTVGSVYIGRYFNPHADPAPVPQVATQPTFVGLPAPALPQPQDNPRHGTNGPVTPVQPQQNVLDDLEAADKLREKEKALTSLQQRMEALEKTVNDKPWLGLLTSNVIPAWATKEFDRLTKNDQEQYKWMETVDDRLRKLERGGSNGYGDGYGGYGNGRR